MGGVRWRILAFSILAALSAGACTDEPGDGVTGLAPALGSVAGTTAELGPIPVYSVQLVGGTVARALNDQGDAVGWGTPEGNARAFLYTDEAGFVLLPNPDGRPVSTAWDVSGRAADGVVEVVGSAYTDVLDEPGHAVRWRVTAATGRVLEVLDLGVLPGDQVSEARAVNDRGVVVGYSNPRSFLSVRPFRFTDAGGMSELGVGGLAGYALDINEAGTVTGYSGLQAFRAWADGRVEMLGGNPTNFPYSTGYGINESNQVAGSLISNSEITGNRVARYTDGVGWEILGGIGHSRTENMGWAIDDAGTVVGRGMIYSPGPRAVIYRDDIARLVYLDDLLAGDQAGWSISYAHDINGSGRIAGGGGHSSGVGGGVILTPVGTLAPPAAPTDLSAEPRPATSGQPYNAIAVSWTDASADEDGFRLERRGPGDATFVEVFSTPSTSYLDASVELCALYEYRVSSWNLAGSSSWTGPVAARAPCDAPDVTPPTVAFVQPVEGDTVSGRVNVVVEAADDRAVARIVLYADNGFVCDAPGSPLECTWNARKASTGAHSLVANAFDAMGNAAQAVVRVEIVDEGGDKGNGKGGGKKGR